MGSSVTANANEIQQSLPLVSAYDHRSVMAWGPEGRISWGAYLRDAAGAAKRLPDSPYVINLCSNPYWFLVGFAAALLREQITLLPARRDQESLDELARRFGKTYCIVDGNVEASPRRYDIRRISVPAPFRPIPCLDIPQDRVVAVAFTSGTTDKPKANLKTWGSLVAVAHTLAQRLEISEHAKITIAATVPPSHMYGLEAAVMLPLQHGMSILFSRPLFPEDIRIALEKITSPKALITTPLHLKACLAEGARLPQLRFILSATSPLPHSLALEAEAAFNTKVFELYGFTEAGSVATRRPVVENEWRLLDGLTLVSAVNGRCVHVPYLNQAVPIPDVIEPLNGGLFLLQGRNEDLVKIGGRRASLDELNRKLNEVPGVKDAVFVLPPEEGGRVARLVAFVVAPGKSAADLLICLRQKIEHAFLPRELIFVSSLPRNELGKITKEALSRLLAAHGKTGYS